VVKWLSRQRTRAEVRGRSQKLEARSKMAEVRRAPHPDPLLREERESGARVRGEHAGSEAKAEGGQTKLEARSKMAEVGGAEQE